MTPWEKGNMEKDFGSRRKKRGNWGKKATNGLKSRKKKKGIHFNGRARRGRKKRGGYQGMKKHWGVGEKSSTCRTALTQKFLRENGKNCGGR